MTRHSASREREWRPILERGAALTGIVLLVLAGFLAVRSLGGDAPEAGGGSGDPGSETDPTASECTAIEVAVDDRLTEVVETVVAADPALADCVSVTGDSSAATMASLTGEDAPDLAIVDSSLRLKGDRRAAAESVASSPVVLAMPRDRAEEAGWPGTQPTWSELIDSGAPMAFSAGTGPADPDPATTLTLTALAQDGLDLTALARQATLPTSADAGMQQVRDGLATATPAAEVDVATTGGRGDLVAAYDPALAGAALDFPAVVLTDDPDERAIAEQLLTALTGDGALAALDEAGLRGPHGAALTGLGEDDGVLPNAIDVAPAPDRASTRRALRAFDQGAHRSDLVLLVDRSGSMLEDVPEQPDVTRADLAQGALAGLVEGLAPDAGVGLWWFAGEATAEGYQVVVPTGPLDEDYEGEPRRDGVLDQIDQGIAPEVGRSTPLFRAVLAARRAAAEDYTPGRLNAVVLMTDGRNEDAEGPTLAELLDTLSEESAPKRPVPVIAVAYGTDADTETLQQIADATDGVLLTDADAGELSAALDDVRP